MLRVAIVCEFGTVNGGERSMLAALGALRSDVQPIFLCPEAGPLAELIRAAGFEQRSFDVRAATGERRPRPEVLEELTARTRELQPDVLHANSVSMGRLTGAIATEVAVPCTAHLRDMLRLSRTALNELGENRHLFAVSQATRDCFVQQGLPSGKIGVLYNGVDLTEFSPATDDGPHQELCDELKLPRDSVLLATVGQVGLRKGQDVLAAAAADIIRQVPRVQFLVIGERYSGKAESVAFEANLERTVTEAGVRSHWQRLGYRRDIARILRSVDGLVHPAHQEPLGRVLLEAAASGLGIVATNVGGTAEILSPEKSALLVPPGDVNALVTAVQRLAGDSVLRRKLGGRARRDVAEKFALPDRAAELLAAWRSLTD